MRNILVLLCVLYLNLPALATKTSFKDKNEVRYIKDKQLLDAQLQSYYRSQSLWKDYISDFPEWYVIFNEYSGLPYRAFGKPVQLSSAHSSEVFNFFSSKNFILPNDLRSNHSLRNDKHINIEYTQYFEDIEVLDSRLYVKLTLNNELIVFGMDLYNDINIDVLPTISTDQAISSASSGISSSISNVMVENDLKILPIPYERDYTYHLIYVINFSTRIDQGPADYRCYIDAHTGELLMRENKVLYELPPAANISVQGEVYTTTPNNPTSVEKFVDLEVVYNNTSYYTDNAGNVTIPSNSGTAQYYLEGNFAKVQINNYVPTFNSSLSNTSVFFNNSNSTIQERTAYHSVNRIHSHLKSIFPTFTALDIPMPTNVDEAGSCNAYYNGSSINFYEQGGGCHATANFPDVVFHEYGHAINGWRYGSGMQNGAQNEGYADLWALTLTEHPILGEGWYLNDPTSSVRRYDQDRKVYPQDLVGEVHADGEIIAGAFWDTYLNLGNMQQMIDLFKYTFDGAPQAANGDEGNLYTAILLEVLYADDNDADITNGTPNDLDIINAFALHGITLLSNAVINHNPIEFTNANTPININANVTLLYPWQSSIVNPECYYRFNNANTWNNTPMTINGSLLQVSIPSMSDGNILAYYISLIDNYGYESGVTPIAANLNPINNANLPYFTLIGYELNHEEDFDFNVGFWQTGDASDNATTGMWEIGSPIASYDDPMNFSGIVQTGSQHTPGGFSCAFTQNASSVLSGIGDSDVDGGHTTLYSPYFDLTNYVNPAFSYYRWYTNSPPSGANPGADWWQVLISNNPTSSNPTWHYVENNKTGEINWRKFAFRVKDYINLSNEVQLKFIASDSIRLGQNLDGGSLIEAAVDDLYLYESTSSQTIVENLSANNRKLLKVIDLLGREVNVYEIYNTTHVIYIYDDGTVVKDVLIR